jgi:phosphoglycerate dehydrogenase-like enzyme
MSHVVWTQWHDLVVPEGFTRLSPANFDLESGDLSRITFYVPQYMSGRAGYLPTQKMDNLQYFQVPNAGYDDALEFVRSGVTLCNARGVHDASTAELAVGLAIAMRRGLNDFVKAHETGEWMHERYTSLNDSKIAIVGYGSIGQTLYKYLSVYDVEITGYSRSGSDGAKKISELDRDISSYDIIFLTLPLNNESRNLFDTNRLAKMKDGSLIVNVARGPIINTDALLKELHSRRIYAGLDVTDPEPLPVNHPLWKAPNCLISPHVGGDSTAFSSRGKRLVEQQLARLAAGEKLINVVNESDVRSRE